nr:UvrD-like helicase, ATP-binding domain, P-loop containing nucleoside triphosphate hydrolase [Tanacetum cinerariifolium]
MESWRISSNKWSPLFSNEDYIYKKIKDNKGYFNSKRFCIKTKLVENIFGLFKIISQGKVIWFHTKEVSGWIPDFVKDDEEESDTDDEIRDEELHDESAEDVMDYLNLVIDNYNGEVVIMGDFNEVHKQPERYGYIFNVQGVEAFNSCISAASLEEGYSGDDVFDLIGDVVLNDENRDIGMGDSTCVLASLDGEIFSGVKKCQESNIGDSDNTGDGGKIVGGAIGACSGGILAWRTYLDGKSKVVIAKVLPLFSITMALIPICNTLIFEKYIAEEANLGYYFIVQ